MTTGHVSSKIKLNRNFRVGENYVTTECQDNRSFHLYEVVFSSSHSRTNYAYVYKYRIQVNYILEYGIE